MRRAQLIEVPRILLTNHGRQRLGMRHLSEDMVFETECFGRRGRYQPGGAELWRVDRRIAHRLRHVRPSLSGLIGVTVITSADGVCLTAYRNRKGKRLLRKAMRPGRGHGRHN
jgi:hypothetical protein